MQISVPSKLPEVGTTIFSVMSQLAAQHQAVNLSQGFPDFPCDEKLIDMVSQYMRHGMNQYAPMQGLITLRERIGEKYQDLYQAVYNPDTEITVTAGGSEAIFSVIAALVHAGDEAIVFEPAYDLYRPAIELNGGVVKAISLEAPSFAIDWTSVNALITEKTKLIVINNPNNPAATCLKEEDMEALVRITKDTQIIILSDEVYEHIVFDEKPFLSLCRYPELKERSMIIASFGKLLHATGWKVGYCVAPVYLMSEFRKVHQFNVFSVHTPTQYAIADYLKEKDTYLSLAAFFQEKRDFFLKGLAGSKFDLLPSEGTYFMLASYGRISDLNDADFAKQLVVTHKVATIPVGAFYNQRADTGLIRFCFAKKEETLMVALEQLTKLSS